METLSSPNSGTLQTNYLRPEKTEDKDKNTNAIKGHAPNPDTIVHNIDPACPHFKKTISQREASNISTESLPSVKKKTLSKELGLSPVHCRHKANTREYCLKIERTKKRIQRKDTVLKKTTTSLVHSNLIMEARQLNDEKKYEDSSRILESVLNSMKKNHDPYLHWDATSVMAYSAGYRGDYIGALKYFDITQKQKKYISPADIVFFSQLYLGFNVFCTKKNKPMIFSSFNPNIAKNILFENLPEIISDSHDWSIICTDNPDYKPYIQGLINIKGKVWDITKQLDELNKLGNSHLPGFLCCIAAHNLINNCQYEKAEEMATEAGRLLQPFYKNYFIAMLSIKRGHSKRAFELLCQEFMNGQPVFNVFSQLLIEAGHLDTAAHIFQYAAVYFEKEDNPHEATYYNLNP